MYLSLTYQLSQTAVVKDEMSSTFPTVPIKLNNSQLQFCNETFMGAVSRKGVSNCFAIKDCTLFIGGGAGGGGGGTGLEI